MRAVTKSIARVGAFALVLALAACGGGGGGSNSGSGAPSGTSASSGTTSPAVSVPPWTPGVNVVAMVVDKGTDGSAVNTPFVDVTICVPGSSSCQTIDHVMVDTGSYGLRIAATALNGQANLPAVTAPSGAPLAECAGFVSGYAWGSVRTADVQIGGETALGVPVQVVDDRTAPYTTVPSGCTSTGPSMGVGSGAKGILGVGFLVQDCGARCASSTAPRMYYACPSNGTCASSIAPLASQVTNPVAMFPTDNNGVTLTLPEVPPGGTAGATGVLVFGVGTAPNNQLGSAQVYTADASGSFSTNYKGRSLSGFIDSGSNGIFVHDASIPLCSGSGFYCPPSPLSLTASVTGANGAASDIPFSMEIVSSSSAAGHLGGDLGLSSFDWGLPFFFGRTVSVAIQGASTPFGTGPYWAF